MRRGTRTPSAAVALFAMAIACSAIAQDQFAFLPKGGAMLLVEVLEGCDACEDLATLATFDFSAEEWFTYFQDHDALAELSEPEADVLVHYLEIYFPREGISDPGSLPTDGRAIIARNCHLCHTVAVAVTQERSVERWQSFGMLPPHDTLRISELEWVVVAQYLARQTPIPMERIPEVLRRGAGGY
jgi:hypothetical protein